MADRHVSEREQELQRKAHQYMPGGTNGNVPAGIIIKGGRGSRIWDVSGNEYIDYLLGSGPMIVGHAHPEVDDAVRNQLGSGTTFFGVSELMVVLAEQIVNAVPCADKVRYCSTGTEATMYAMRAARAFRGRDKILKFEGGFHGMNDYSLMSLSPSGTLDFPKAEPSSAGIPKSLQDEVLIAPFNDIETTSAIIEEHHDDLGGVIVEPLQRLFPPKAGFLEGLREITSQYEIPLIFDEVVTGFRLSYGGAQEYYGVTPDLCSLGKAVAGGYPLTAVAGRDEIMAHFDQTATPKEDALPQVGTLNGNPISAAAGLATLNILRRSGTYERTAAMGKTLKDGLQERLDVAEIPAKVVGESVLFDVFFTEHEVENYRDSLKADGAKLNELNGLLREQGIFKGGSKYYLSTAHDDDDVKATLSAFDVAIEQLGR